MSEERRPTNTRTTDARQLWLHGLRNEIATAAIGAASARRLLETDRRRAQENLLRVENACLRCAELLRAPP